ncbi:MAG TPA: STAS domain-containing protein [Terriglobales bacterium]
MHNSSAILIKLPETFGAKEARKLERELKSKLSNESANLVADFSRVKKMDLNGMEALLECMEGVAQKDGALQITGMSPEAATLFELTRMDQLFAKFPGFAAEAPTFEFSPEMVPETAQEVTVESPVAA